MSNEGCDAAGLSERMRQQVEQRSGRKVEQHLLDGGYLRHDDIERAAMTCRQVWGLGSGPVANMCRVLENAGAKITDWTGAALTLDSETRCHGQVLACGDGRLAPAAAAALSGAA